MNRTGAALSITEQGVAYPDWALPAVVPGAPASDTLPCQDCNPPKRFWAAFGTLMLVQLIPHFVNANLRGVVWAEVSVQSIKNNLVYPWQWDDNQFLNNQFSHPYQGNFYFNAARANGYNFWQSFAWPFAGSLMWEIAGEAWAPAPNDFLNTGFGGVVLGETFFRLSSLALDNTATGSERTWREIGGALLNPIRGFNRLVRGETSRVAANPPDWRPSRVFGVVDLGFRRTANSFSIDSITEGTDQWDASFALMYGDAVKDLGKAPFSYFTMSAQLAGPPPEGGHRLNRLGYDYFSNPAVEYGGQSVQVGVVSEFGTPGATIWAQTNILVNGIIVGATQSDYYTTAEGRNYDYGPGLGTLINGRLFYRRRVQASVSYLGSWIHTIDGANSAHYQDALALEGRYWVTDRLGGGVSVTRYSRHSVYAGLPDVSQDANFFRVFVSTAIPGVPQ